MAELPTITTLHQSGVNAYWIEVEGLIDSLLLGSPVNTQTAPTKRMNSSQRRKQELQQLRAMATHFESQLDLLKREHEATTKWNAKWTSGMADAWRDEAMYYKMERAKAEAEQKKLQEQLADHLKIASRLQSLVKMCELWRSFQPFSWDNCCVAVNQDTRVFQELVQSVDSRYSMMKATMGSFRGPSEPFEVSDSFTLKSVHVNKLCFESMSTFAMPFDYRLVDKVLWDSLRSGSFAMTGDHITVVRETPELVLSKLVDRATGTITMPTVFYQAMKRFPCEDYICIVWEISALLPGTSEAWPTSAGIVSRGWGRLRPVMLRDGSVGSLREECSQSSITILKPESGLVELDEMNILIHTVETIAKEKRAKASQLIENLLVDAVVIAKTARGSKASYM